MNKFLLKSEDKKNSDFNKSIIYTISSSDISIDELIKKINCINNNFDEYNYDWENDKYYEDFFNNNSESLNYYGGNLSKTKYGLEKSQLKTLFAIFNTDDKIIPINGAPGSGKSTLLNYVISNILINSLIEQFEKLKVYNNLTISNFLKNNLYKIPKIFLTGHTKISVRNASDICKIMFDDNHDWIGIDSEKIPVNLFNSLDFCLIDENKNLDNLKNNYFPFVENKYDNELTKIYFHEKFKKWYNLNEKNEILWEEIPNILYKKILENIDEIKKINNIIKNEINGNLEDKIILFKKILNSKEKITFLSSLKSKNISKYDLKIIVDYYVELVKEINELDDIEINDKKLKFTRKFCKNYEKIKNKNAKKLIKKIKKSAKEINNFLNVHKEIQDLIVFLKNIDENLSGLSDFFDYEDKKNFQMDKFQIFKEFDFKKVKSSKYIDENVFSEIMLNLNIIRINFTNIQQKLDRKNRLENWFLYRHICEWTFLSKFK